MDFTFKKIGGVAVEMPPPAMVLYAYNFLVMITSEDSAGNRYLTHQEALGSGAERERDDLVVGIGEPPHCKEDGADRWDASLHCELS